MSPFKLRTVVNIYCWPLLPVSTRNSTTVATLCLRTWQTRMLCEPPHPAYGRAPAMTAL